MSSFYRQQLELFLSELHIKANVVLDIGGEQGHVSGRVGSWDVQKYHVLDLPEYDLAKDWSTQHYLLQDKANVVFCLEVFEYLIDPMQGIKNIEFVMKRNKVSTAKAYISAPLIYPVHNEIDRDSLRYTENGFRRLCDAVGLEVTNVWYRRPVNELLTSYYSMDGMKAVRGHDHHVTGYLFEVTK